MDTVLVTGGRGHLGRDLVPRLKRSCRVPVLARSPGSDPDVEWIRGDLAGGEDVAEGACSLPARFSAVLDTAQSRGGDSGQRVSPM